MPPTNKSDKKKPEFYESKEQWDVAMLEKLVAAPNIDSHELRKKSTTGSNNR